MVAETPALKACASTHSSLYLQKQKAPASPLAFAPSGLLRMLTKHHHSKRRGEGGGAPFSRFCTAHLPPSLSDHLLCPAYQLSGCPTLQLLSLPSEVLVPPSAVVCHPLCLGFPDTSLPGFLLHFMVSSQGPLLACVGPTVPRTPLCHLD